MKSFHFDVDLLRTFVCVADAKSFTIAGERLHRTQSAVSVKIKKLEDQLGHRLLDRTSPVRPTSIGAHFLETARRLIDAHEDAFIELTQACQVERITVGTSETYAVSLLSPVLKNFKKCFPQLEIEIRCGHSWDLLEAQSSERIDLVLATHSPKHSGVTLQRQKLIWVCGPNSIAYQEERLPLAVFPNGCLYRDAAIAALVQMRRPWSIAYTCSHYDGLLAAISTESALTALTESAIPSQFKRLDRSHGLPDLPTMDVALYRAPEISPVARKLGSVIEAYYLGDQSVVNPVDSSNQHSRDPSTSLS
ncbi:LysR family transcriptional regulator [Verminephrobacter aporrectodeae subsp. tuberculatae]|uniref:LysR family transcriptional regulator n=1 Tax=Verminephrobacter aporrectodeae TaxID=1110389 RepID=UPI002238CA2E|nr:LysR substrate-binding domain-containing protein [Verminephrobacter aporrectodeae]MCW5223351.1 LysR family transcriptional regulator [Verminephrobacter aporrectodeae subsp. tuberculatae]MCW5288815.1 LysR family transcriptional regulator [Verminephrobacter aporrectodeae subsp. tuberculatae]